MRTAVINVSTIVLLDTTVSSNKFSASGGRGVESTPWQPLSVIIKCLGVMKGV